MVALHTALVFIFIIRTMYVHQQGKSWSDDYWHKSWALSALVTNLLAIVTNILVRI